MIRQISTEREFVLDVDASDEDLIRHYVGMLAVRHRIWPSDWDINILSFGNGYRRLRAGCDVADYVTTPRLTRCLWARYMDDYGVAGNYFRQMSYNIIIPAHMAKRPPRTSGIVQANKVSV